MNENEYYQKNRIESFFNSLLASVGSEIKNNWVSIFQDNNNKPLNFNLSNLPNVLKKSEKIQNLIKMYLSDNINNKDDNSNLKIKDIFEEDIDIKIELPIYTDKKFLPNYFKSIENLPPKEIELLIYKEIVIKTSQKVTCTITITINKLIDNSSRSQIIELNLLPLTILFQQITSISFNMDVSKLTINEFIEQYVTPNNFNSLISIPNYLRVPIANGIGTNNLPALKEIFNINILPTTWFNNWTPDNIIWASITADIRDDGLIKKIYVKLVISDLVQTTIMIPTNIFASPTSFKMYLK